MYEADNSLLAIVLRIFIFYNLFSVLKAEAEHNTASVQQCVTLWLAAEK